MPSSGPAAVDAWGEDDNAARYGEFARLYPGYRDTSRDLIALASPAREARVLDLACGTGATTGEILSVLGPAGRVVAVDKSPAMLREAAACIQDPRVRWVQGAAEEVDHHLADPVEVAICNSAIWQTDLAATATAVRSGLATGGRFAFNIGAGFLEQRDDPNELGDLPLAMRAIAVRDYGWTAPAAGSRSATSARPRLSREAVCGWLSAAGFEIERVEELSYTEAPEVQRAWLAVPVFTRNYLPGLPYPERMRVLAKAYAQVGPGEARTERWVAFAATAVQGRP
ncbi:MAG TPA: class I SAM-dependent methyltransferase [Streptosporangiaceae bacterium]|nr:class I SAM-dependent methyltransferase [Streptosporangiaceae bacterium]